MSSHSALGGHAAEVENNVNIGWGVGHISFAGLVGFV